MAEWWKDDPVTGQGGGQFWQQDEMVSHPAFDESKVPDSQRAHPSDGGILDTIGAYAASALEGLPVVGPSFRNVTEDLAALAVKPFSDQSLSDIRSGMDRRNSQNIAEHPVASTAGGITGAVGGTIPMILAAPAAFGAGSAPLWARSVVSGLTSAGLGGGDAAVRSGGDPNAAANGAVWGGGLGLVAPGIGSAMGAGTRALANRFAPQAGSAAERMFARAATDDNVTDLGPRLAKLGPDAMPMDLGPNLQRQAGALAATPGEAQNVVRSAIGARDAGANTRIQGAVDETLGPAPALQKIDAQIKTNMDALGPQYEAAFKRARAVNTDKIAGDLESKIVNLRGDAQKAARKVRDMLDIEGTDQLDPNPYTLFQTRQAIDGMLATEANPKVIGVLSDARKAIDNQLAFSVPGIKKLDARFAELARQKEGIQRGMQTLDNGRTAPRPSELAADMQSSGIAQGDMVGPSAVPMRLREGARAEIDRIIGTNANDRVALQRLIKGEGDWNRSRLASLFGQDKADRIIGVLDRERTFADTSNIVTRNSETAARQAAQGEIAPAKAPGLVRSFDIAKPGQTAAMIGDKVFGRAADAAAQARNAELARLLTSNDPAAVGRKLQMVQAAQRRGDISAQQAKQITQSIVVGSSQRRQPLEITVSPGRF